MVLLGSDARLRFVDPAKPEQGLDWIIPGQPVGVEIVDADMDLRSDLPDRVAASLGVPGSADRLLLVLEETGIVSEDRRDPLDSRHSEFDGCG